MSILETQRLTLEAYKALPEGPPYYEFEEGLLIPRSSPTIDHQDIIDELTVILRPHIREKRLGRLFTNVDVYLPDGRVYIPDIGFLSTARQNFVNPVDRKIHGAPDLVIEVTSSDESRDRIHKFRIYHSNGVEWYWLITQETLAIEEYRWTPEGYLLVSGTVAGEVFRPQLFFGLTIDLQTLLSQSEENA